MATENYTDFQETFTELMEEFGWSTSTITVETVGAYDVATSSASVSSAVTTVDAVLIDLTGKMVGKTLANGVIVTEYDKRVLLPVGTAPSIGDKMTFGSDIYEILYIKEINPGGTIIGYDLVVRNG
jgi:hypothetical protein